ncbi:phosphoheptose isomerase [Methylobacillus rhizosphaerae]|uniref:Phosphoheptose isomerase n=1 Tax=Methylobacillus rhizosphaerae TaxID=551994 RepID=A0A238XYC6_9PROT|nr:SIS domain-containing protein [Methylobacillus rhizosphaerae]SNR63710.1 phosphoheptose isomerase [Methylobacillus rhizosphaerae]
MTDLNTRITAHFEESGRLKLALAELLASPIASSAEIIVQALLNEKKILTCGNGGSASSAQYFASRMLNRYDLERPGLAAIALPADISTLTSIANDSHFEQVFARQITALGHHGDILLALSTSGNSSNILQAISAAKDSGMQVIALSGGDGGDLMELLTDDDIHIGVPHEHPARIQEVYILTLHCLCDAIDCLLLGVN